jgi:hypothetical protein
MALLVEKEVRAYQTKANTTICPVCASVVSHKQLELFFLLLRERGNAHPG